MLLFKDICAGYGKTWILNMLSFEVPKGCIYGIIGPNGCGKTTMLNTLMGLLHPAKGVILFEGHDITSLKPDTRCRRGIGWTFQIPHPFERISVYENVLAGVIFGGGYSRKAGREKALEVLELTDLAEKRNIAAGQLGLLDRKRLEVARAISTQPKLLLLDEVAAGLTNAETEYMTSLVRLLQGSGYTIIWIEHILDIMANGTDHLMCMAQGRCLIHGLPRDVLQSYEVQTLYLGKDRGRILGGNKQVDR